MWSVDESKFLTPLETKHLRKHLSELAKAGGRRNVIRWMVVDLGLSAGLRASEISNLMVADCYINHGQSSILVRNGKFNKTASVVISEKLKRHLKEFISWCGVSDSDHLLINERGDKYTRIGIYKLIKKVFKDLGLPERYSPHSLRHTFASTLYRETKNLRLVMRQCRHSSPTVTSVYADLLDDELKEGMERLY